MTVDYEALRRENELEYGRGIGRIGKMLLEDRYDKRTHFIYEILQNTEDALRRRNDWSGSRTVTFFLTETELWISHFGSPFSEADVRGVCGIHASTKDYTSIGRFGIGFKSVYAFTSRPEVHSGNENFAIRDYVFPSAVPPCDRDPNETIILLPLRGDDPEAFAEIAGGLKTLGAEALLFLKHVEEIAWGVEGGESGSYRRSVKQDGFMREVELVTDDSDGRRSDTYLLFTRDVENKGKPVGQAEIAFLTTVNEGRRVIQPLADARLVVFFPTVLPTHTGFLVQGPYQTTPSRDNIPSDKPWNVRLAAITGDLLVDVLLHLREAGLLDVAALRSLPLERQKLSGSLFSPLLERTVEALRKERLLPTTNGKFASALEARLARAQDVRDLFGPKQLGNLLGINASVYWVTSDITNDRTPQLRNFLLQELKIPELTLDAVLARMPDNFLVEQSDTWMLRFYRLLASQPALWRGRAKDMALIRLEDGQHVPLIRHGVIQAFLPGDGKTGFPTVRSTLCTPQTLKFLQGIGLTKPDPVDDVVRNLLPNYRKETIDTSSYDDDIARIRRAFWTDSQAQRDKLVEALSSSYIVMVKDAGTGKDFIAPPGDVYLAVDHMVSLFRDVENVFILDNDYECLRGEKIQDMLEECGATRILRTIISSCDLTPEERRAARRNAGWEGCSSEVPIRDLNIAGLDDLLQLLPTLPEAERRDRARLLWVALAELVDSRGASVLSVTYTWHYHYQRSTEIEAKFVRQLNEIPWIPSRTGELRRPSEVLFDDLDWPAHPLLESRIRFKPPAVAALAREVGIDPEVLDELKRLGVTDLEQLRTRLKQDPTEASGAANAEIWDDEEEVGGEGDAGQRDEEKDRAEPEGDGQGFNPDTHSPQGNRNGTASDGAQSGGRKNHSRSGGGREFISYVGVRPDDLSDDPDGLTQQERMDLEENAIAHVLRFEPLLERTEVGNKGFDLVENDVAGEPQRWVEVKAMTGTLKDRPVVLSRAQMEHARRCGDQFWLYVVEYAADDDQARILKIQDPYGAAGSFTFDHGWTTIATIANEGDLPAAAE